jgi:hypothetical protein
MWAHDIALLIFSGSQSLREGFLAGVAKVFVVRHVASMGKGG